MLPLDIMALKGGGGVLGLAVVYHGFRGNHRSCPCISWLEGGPGSCPCISWLEGGPGSCPCISLSGGVLGLALVYHCLGGGGSLVLPLYIMALGGIIGLALVYHG